jgi:hypothetical protein
MGEGIMSVLDTGQGVRACRTPIRSRVATGLLIAVVVLAGCGDDDSGDAVDSDPVEVIENYRIAYNDGDIDAVMALFSEESVVSGHPFAVEAAGLAAIRHMQLLDMGAAAETDAYKILNVEVSGDTVTWDHVWTTDDGTDWCAEGHNAVIANGQILTWTFAADGDPCA